MKAITRNVGRSACFAFAATALLVIWLAAAVPGQDKTDDLRVSSDDRLGLFFVKVNETLARDLGVSKGYFVITGVLKGGAADEARLFPGDVIVAARMGKEYGVTANLKIRRQGRDYDLEFKTRKHDFVAGFELVEGTRADQPKNIRVDPVNSDKYRSITAALLAAAPGDTVTVADGLYREQLLMPSGVTLQAATEGGAVIHSDLAIRIFGAGRVTLRGLSLVGDALIDSARDVTLQSCSFTVAEVPGIEVNRTRNAIIRQCTVSGKKDKTYGVRMTSSQGRVEECSFFGNKWGVYVQKKSDIVVAECLLDDNTEGVSAYDSVVVARKNMITGNGLFSGVVAFRSTMDVQENAVRQHRFGVSASQSKGTIRGNTISQNINGVYATAGDLNIRENLILENKNHGIHLYGGIANIPADAERKAVVTHNTVSGNEGVGIWIEKFQAKVEYNLVELNTAGIRAEDADVKVNHNTVVLHKGFGILVGRNSAAEVFRNIVGFNNYGLYVDVTARGTWEHNLVYGNLPRAELPLYDGNYVRRDRLPTRGGEKFVVQVLPALELKAPTDINEDPRFVAKGTDYRLRTDSPAARTTGESIGAFAVKND